MHGHVGQNQLFFRIYTSLLLQVDGRMQERDLERRKFALQQRAAVAEELKLRRDQLQAARLQFQTAVQEVGQRTRKIERLERELAIVNDLQRVATSSEQTQTVPRFPIPFAPDGTRGGNGSKGEDVGRKDGGGQDGKTQNNPAGSMACPMAPPTDGGSMLDVARYVLSMGRGLNGRGMVRGVVPGVVPVQVASSAATAGASTDPIIAAATINAKDTVMIAAATLTMLANSRTKK